MATVDIGYRSNESWYSSNRSSKRIVLRGFIVQWERRDEVIVSGVYCGVLFELDFIFFWAILGDSGVQWVGSELVIIWRGEGQKGKKFGDLKTGLLLLQGWRLRGAFSLLAIYRYSLCILFFFQLLLTFLSVLYFVLSSSSSPASLFCGCLFSSSSSIFPYRSWGAVSKLDQWLT